jgi:hypothetical protein
MLLELMLLKLLQKLRRRGQYHMVVGGYQPWPSVAINRGC